MPNRFLFGCLVACALFSAITLPAQPRAAVDATSLTLPAIGDYTLRVLSPSLLEITQISTKAKNAAWPAIQTAAGTGAEARTAEKFRFTVNIGGRPVQVNAVGTKRRVLYAPLARRDLRVATTYYLRLATRIEPDAAIEVRLASAAAGQPLLSLKTSFDPLRFSPVIHVNQEGYLPLLPKKVMLGYYLGDLGEMDLPVAAGFTLIDAATSAVVHEGTLTPRRDVGYKTTPLPYQQVLVADFSAFTTPGEYRLQVPGLGASAPFLIDDGIARGVVRTYALGLYHQRCGAENALPFTRFTHAACHLAPAQIPVPQSRREFDFTWSTLGRTAAEASADTPRQTAPLLTSEASQLYPFVKRGPADVSGGHHDAGDYSKYTVNSAALLHYLVFTADSIAGAGALDHLGLPESGDGISDILQEAKREADYLAKLQDTDGGFYFLVYPKTRAYEANVLPEHGDTQVVWPKNTAVTAAAVAALAQTASSPQFKRHYPQVAAAYLQQAEHGWQFLTRAIAKHGKAGAYQKITFYGDHYTHDDELAWAACELFLATGNPAYQRQLFAWFPNPADYATYRWGWWRMSEGWGNTIRSYAFAARSGRLPATALDARYLRICEGEIIAAGNDVLDWSNKNAYGTPFPIATKAVRGAGWYFSLDQASDMAIAFQIEPKPAYREALVAALNYEAGGNPNNVTFLSGLGRRRQREIVHHYALNDRRTLPPTGIPIGNIHAAFQHLPAYGFELRDASYPDDNAATRPFPFYDRWSDAHNVTTEFIAVNQARGLLAAAVLAQPTAAASTKWIPPRAELILPDGPVALRTPVTLRVHAPGEDLGRARIVWEARDQEPAFGPTYTFTPQNNGPQWVEAEIAWPDGRRAFATGTFSADNASVAWVDDALPAGATPGATGGDDWNWIATNPAPQSGRLAHQSNLATGLHEHWFTGASATLAVGPGDELFAWVYLDPQHPPREIMLMWHDGTSWEHRAYWGANLITYGRDGTAGRHAAGPLPATGQWIRLSVPARAVGLEGATVSGLGFSLIDGRATWDAAGRAASDSTP